MTVLAWATLVAMIFALVQWAWRRKASADADAAQVRAVAAEKQVAGLQADLAAARSRVDVLNKGADESLARVMALQGALVAKIGHDEAAAEFQRLFGGTSAK